MVHAGGDAGRAIVAHRIAHFGPGRHASGSCRRATFVDRTSAPIAAADYRSAEIVRGAAPGFGQRLDRRVDQPAATSLLRNFSPDSAELVIGVNKSAVRCIVST
jgi:hypothetical protein